MLPRRSRSLNQICNRAGTRRNIECMRNGDFNVFTCRQAYSQRLRLQRCWILLTTALLLDPRVEDPKYEGIRHIFLKLMLFYSKQSKSIRGANVIYSRVVYQIDKPAIYNVFSLENTFKTTFSLLVLHMCLCLRRLKEEGREGVDLGQYLYEIYNHDVEMRVSKAGVNLLLSRWMKDLEKVFYGNIVAYDTAMLPEAKQDELKNVIWRNVFSDDSLSLKPNDAALREVQAMSRYVRRECSCMSLTDKEAIFSGNFLFTPLENTTPFTG